jgi:hypothetical protein
MIVVSNVLQKDFVSYNTNIHDALLCEKDSTFSMKNQEKDTIETIRKKLKNEDITIRQGG